MQVANTILKQIGNAALTMIGGKHFVGSPDGVAFRIGRNVKGINIISIKLVNDLYNIDFASQRGTSYKVKSKATGVYCDMLTGIIAENTGMAISLYSRK